MTPEEKIAGLEAMIAAMSIELEETYRSVVELTNELSQRSEDLERAITEVKTLEGIIPICSGCRRLRDDSGFWQRVEAYVQERSEAKFSHGLCPDCRTRLYPDLD